MHVVIQKVVLIPFFNNNPAPASLNTLIERTNKGDTDACLQLAEIYENAINCKQNWAMALIYYQKTENFTEEKNGIVAAAIARMSINDRSNASHFLFNAGLDKLCCKENLPVCLKELEAIYPPDPLTVARQIKGLTYLELAHQLGHSEAAWMIAQTYDIQKHGRCITPLDWHKIAADQGNGEACFRYAESLRDAEPVNDEIQQDKRNEVPHYFRLAHHHGYDPAASALANWYYHLLCSAQKNIHDRPGYLESLYNEAKKWCEIASDQGDGVASFQLAQLLKNPTSGATAIVIADAFVLACEQGCREAKAGLVNWYASTPRGSVISPKAMKIIRAYVLSVQKKIKSAELSEVLDRVAKVRCMQSTVMLQTCDQKKLTE